MKTDEKNKDEIVWRAAEREHRERDISWYWAVGTVAVILAMVALWQKNFFFFVFVVLAGAMVLFLGKRRPQVLEFRVTDKGIGVGHSIFYAFADLEWFDIKRRLGRLSQIVVKRKAVLNPIMRIPVDDSLADEVGKFLESRLPRKEHEDSLIDSLSDWMGF